jgi:hypothetical protein
VQRPPLFDVGNRRRRIKLQQARQSPFCFHNPPGKSPSPTRRAGPVRFDHLGNVVGDVFIRRCERLDGQLVNTIIKRYPDVMQFSTYDEKAFLANPVYTRDYPPAKNLEP